MNYDIVALGSGRLSGASKVDGENIVIVQKGGALHKLKIGGKRVSDMGIVGGGEDCYVFKEGTIFFDPEVRYEANNQ